MTFYLLCSGSRAACPEQVVYRRLLSPGVGVGQLTPLLISSYLHQFLQFGVAAGVRVHHCSHLILLFKRKRQSVGVAPLEGIRPTQRTRDPVTQHGVLRVQLEGDRAEGQVDGVHAFLLKFRYCKEKTGRVTLQPADDGEELRNKRV